MNNNSSNRYYIKELDEIIELTTKPEIPKKRILAPPLVNSTAVNLAIDVILKYLAYFQNPQRSVSHDTTITKHGTGIRIYRDPLEYIINHGKLSHDFRSVSNHKDWLGTKFFWIEFLQSEIISPLLDNKAKKISLKSLEKLLSDLLDCAKDVKVSAKDLYNILNVISVDKFANQFSVINPSFHHINSSIKHFSTQADLIMDDTLLDIKNTKELLFTKDYYRQLLYYYLWSTIQVDEFCWRFNQGNAVSHRGVDEEINNIGFYFPRYDYLIKFDLQRLWKDKDGLVKAKEIFLKALNKKEIIEEREAMREMTDEKWIQRCTDEIQIKPKNAQLYFKRAGHKHNMNDINGAIEDLNKAIDLKPQFAMAYLKREIIKKEISDYKGALEDIKKYIELVPKHASTMKTVVEGLKKNIATGKADT